MSTVLGESGSSKRDLRAPSLVRQCRSGDGWTIAKSREEIAAQGTPVVSSNKIPKEFRNQGAETRTDLGGSLCIRTRKDGDGLRAARPVQFEPYSPVKRNSACQGPSEWTTSQ
jgi:hypothetical protein